jgi:hypothetical protein
VQRQHYRALGGKLHNSGQQRHVYNTYGYGFLHVNRGQPVGYALLGQLRDKRTEQECHELENKRHRDYYVYKHKPVLPELYLESAHNRRDVPINQGHDQHILEKER